LSRNHDKQLPTRRRLRSDNVSMSSPSVDDLVEALSMTGVSKRQVSRLRGELDELTRDFKGKNARRIHGAVHQIGVSHD